MPLTRIDIIELKVYRQHVDRRIIPFTPKKESITITIHFLKFKK